MKSEPIVISNIRNNNYGEKKMFDLPPLPYALDALAPYISAETMNYHYHKHHQTYIDNLNKLIKGTPFENMNLEEIIVKTAKDEKSQAIFNNAAQAWNHTFFWNSMTPNGGQLPPKELAEQIDRDFGSYENFKTEFKQAATTQFGSGWAWLVQDKNGKLSVMKTGNADNPLVYGLTPVITCDIWEHAYYLDYQNRRGDFVDNYLNHLVNWK